MAARFWVGGTANWDAVTTTNWSATSGGLGGAAVPTSSDDVTFDTLSNATAYTVTITATANCNNLTIGNPLSGVITWAGSSALNVFGNFAAPTGGTRTYTGAITFSATATGKTITMNSVALASLITFNGSGGGWTLQDNFNNGSTSGQNIVLSAGTLDTNGKTVTCFFFDANSASTLTLGASTITCRQWRAAASLTLNANTSTIADTVQGFGSANFVGGGLTYNIVTMSVGTFVSGIGLISGANTFTTLSINGAARFRGTLLNDQTITGTLTIAGTNANSARMYLTSDTFGTARTFTVGTTATISNVDFEDITAAGAAGTWSGTSLGDAEGNTNITFTPAVTRFWVSNTGAWTSTAKWSASTGGATGASMPLPQDTAIFDANSVTLAAQTITCSVPQLCANLDASAVLNSPIFAFTQTLMHGNLTLASGVTTTGSANDFGFRNRANSATITSNGATFGSSVNFQGSNTVFFGDNFIGTSTSQGFSSQNGTIDGNGNNVTIVAMSGNNSTLGARTINLGSGTWTLTGTGTVWAEAGGTITVNASTSTIVVSDASGSTKTFGGGHVHNNFNFSGTGIVIIGSSNTFNNFSASPGNTVNFTASTTQTILGTFASGTSSGIVTMQSTSAGTRWIVKKDGAALLCDYIALKDSDAAGGVPFYAGRNSTDNSNNLDWIFDYPPKREQWSIFNKTRPYPFQPGNSR